MGCRVQVFGAAVAKGFAPEGPAPAVEGLDTKDLSDVEEPAPASGLRITRRAQAPAGAKPGAEA